MKDKPDLVLAWLKKAASDLVAMRATAQAGSLDTACFHAQQAAEKYLKAYLLDRDQLIPRTHLQSVTVKINTVNVYAAWKAAWDRFDWEVDLRRFKDARKYRGFFDRVIYPREVVEFEDTFRAALIPGGRIERAAEVAFWKNGANYKARDRIARDLMEWIPNQTRWVVFIEALQALSQTPIWKNFDNLIGACGQVSGFSTPLTYLAFYDPQRFPLIDKRSGKWWSARFPYEAQFIWNREGTVISRGKASFTAYLAWAEFCRRQASELSKLGEMTWRARDVEMAVWADTEARLPLNE